MAISGETAMVDLASKPARLLGVNQPASCEAQPIGEILLKPAALRGKQTGTSTAPSR